MLQSQDEGEHNFEVETKTLRDKSGECAISKQQHYILLLALWQIKHSLKPENMICKI